MAPRRFHFASASLLLFTGVLLASEVHVAARAVNISNTWVLPQEGFPVFYRYFRDQITWYEADAVCQFHHANLVTVDTSVQYDTTRAYLKELDVVSNVWIGLRKSGPKEEYTWTDSKLLEHGGGYFHEQSPVTEAALCAVVDPSQDFLWHSFNCGGPEVAAFVCELPVPPWASKEDGCMLMSLPSLTVSFLPEQAAVELTSDCGLDGTRRIACKGQSNREDMMKQLSCAEATWSTTPETSSGTSNSWSGEPPTRHRRDADDVASTMILEAIRSTTSVADDTVTGNNVTVYSTTVDNHPVPSSLHDSTGGYGTRPPYGSTRHPYGTTPSPVGITRLPYGTRRSSYETTRTPSETTRSPYLTSRHQYGTSRHQYGTSRSPYETTKSPYGTRYPYGTTRSPYGSRISPYGTTRSPYETTRPPYGTTRPPLGTNNYPYETARLLNITSRSPYETTRPPYGTTRYPYETTRFPNATSASQYETTRSPYRTTGLPYEIARSPNATHMSQRSSAELDNSPRVTTRSHYQASAQHTRNGRLTDGWRYSTPPATKMPFTVRSSNSGTTQNLVERGSTGERSVDRNSPGFSVNRSPLVQPTAAPSTAGLPRGETVAPLGTVPSLAEVNGTRQPSSKHEAGTAHENPGKTKKPSENPPKKLKVLGPKWKEVDGSKMNNEEADEEPSQEWPQSDPDDPEKESLELSEVEPDVPTRPNRGRRLTRPQTHSFYPYFLNRVLG